MAEKGTISIHAENIMPIIKRWLYSDKDIFIRELISNGCDAISKYSVLARNGEAPAFDDPRIDVVVNDQDKTIKFSDNGIGMTADEVRRYIAQVAFSGAEEFLQQYKSDDSGSGIIGHFGLGFYSAFMVAAKVEIDTLSYQENAEAVRWVSKDGMEYDIGKSRRKKHGTTITLHMNEDEQAFLQIDTLRGTLEKYCEFMPVPIFLADKHAKADDAPTQINDTMPLWTKKPSECTDEEYKAFYRSTFHDIDEPLFWIHLNADYPFNLKGILYFPRLKRELQQGEGLVKLYSNQVFVADNIKEVIPEFLLLLKGVIDCPELPLNVSRSFLQNDGYVKKMQAYITRKVADRLVSEYQNHREEYQKYWDDIHPFIKYGCIRDEKFYERVKEALLIKTTADQYMTIHEYTEKNGDTVYYTSDEKRQAGMIELFTSEGKDVAIFNTVIDGNFLSFLEYQHKEDAPKFQRVDSQLDELTETDAEVDTETEKLLAQKFKEILGEENTLTVKLANLKSDALPAMVTVDEQARRFTEMSRMWNQAFEMPEQKTLVLNAKHPLVKYLETATDMALSDMLCQQMLDLAEMAREPLTGDRMLRFLKRSNELITLLVAQ